MWSIFPVYAVAVETIKYCKDYGRVNLTRRECQRNLFHIFGSIGFRNLAAH